MFGRFLVFIAGLLVVALFTALLAPYFVDWTGFRQDFETRASIILGKKVVVHGTVSARLLPFPSVTMNDVTVGQDENGQPLVTAQRFAMDMELAPFLSGEARIFEMRIIDPKVHIALQKDGSLDWVRTGNPSIPTKVVVLENVRVTGGELTFEDRQTGRTRHMTNLDFAASAKSLAGPWHFDGSGIFDGSKAHFLVNTGSREDNGQLNVSAHIAPDSQPVTADLDGELKLVNSRVRYDGSFTADLGKPKGGVAPARVKGAFELANDRVRLPQYRMELGDPKDPYVVNGEATLDTGQKPEFLLKAEGQQVDMNAMGASGEDGKRGRNEDAIPASQRLQTFLALLADIPVPPVPGKVELKLPAIVSGDTSYRNISVVAEPHTSGWKIDHAAVELPGRTRVQADGLFELKGNRSFAGTLTVASSQPSGLSAWLAGDVTPEIRSLNATGFSADVDLTDNLQRFEHLELAVGGAILKGRAERQSPKDGPPSLSIDLSGGDLDLDALRALTSLATGKDSASTFFAHTIAAKLNLKNLAADGVVARNVDIAFSLKDKRLSIDRLKVGDLEGAAFSLQGTARGTLTDPHFRLTGDFSADQPGSFLRLVQKYLPDYPVMHGLIDNSDYLKNTRFNFQVAAGEGDDWPVKAKLKGSSDGTNFDLKLSAEDLGLAAGTDLSLDVSGENDDYAILLGQAGLKPLPGINGGHGVVGLTVSRSGKDPANIAMNVTTDSTGFNIKGTGDLTAAHFLDGQYKLLLDSDDLEPLLFMEGYALPEMGAGLPLSVTSALKVKSDSLSFSDIKGKADTENFSGALQLTRAAKPKLTGALALDDIDAGWLAELVAGPLRDENGAFSSRPLPEPGSTPFDAALTLSAKRFWMGYPSPITDFKANMTYASNMVGLTGATGKLGHGSANGDVSLTVGKGQGFLRGRVGLKAADLSDFSWQLSKAVPVLSGKADMTAVIEGSGKSIKDISSQLTGSGSMALTDFDIHGFDANAFPAILSAADGIKGEFTSDKVLPIATGALGQGETHVGAMSVPFSISSGKLRVESVRADAGKVALTFDGETGIVDNTISARLRAVFNPGDEAIAGADPAITVKFDGTRNVPSMSVDATDLSNYLSLRAFERERRKAELLQGRLAERQRLRRETMYFKSLADAREKARLEAEQKAALEAEQKRLAAEKAAADKVAADKAAADKAAKDAARKPALSLDGQVLKGLALPAPSN